MFGFHEGASQGVLSERQDRSDVASLEDGFGLLGRSYCRLGFPIAGSQICAASRGCSRLVFRFSGEAKRVVPCFRYPLLFGLLRGRVRQSALKDWCCSSKAITWIVGISRWSWDFVVLCSFEALISKRFLRVQGKVRYVDRYCEMV